MVVGIGGVGSFRDLGDPYDPRRSLGAIPRQLNISGLPPASANIDVDLDRVRRYFARQAPSGLPPSREIAPGEPEGQLSLDIRGAKGAQTYVGRDGNLYVVGANQAKTDAEGAADIDLGVTRGDFMGIPDNSVAARSDQRDLSYSRARKSRARPSRLRAEQLDPRKNSDFNPRDARGGLSQLLLGEADEVAMVDKALRGQPKVVVTADEIHTERGLDYPALPIEYGDYAYGMPRAGDTADLDKTDNDRFGIFTSEDPTARRRKQEWGTNINPFGTVDVPVRQVSGQWVGPSGDVVIRRIDPKAAAYTRTGNPDSAYSSEQNEEVSLGTALMEAKRAAEAPVITEKAIDPKRFVPAERLPREVLDAYTTEKGSVGTFVGLLETTRPEAYSTALSSLASKKSYTPVYRFMQRDPATGAMVPAMTKVQVPQGVSGVTEEPQALFRLGQPTAYDAERVFEEVRPYLGTRVVRTAPQGVRKTIGAGEVRRVAAAQDYKVFADPRLEVELDPRAIDGSGPVYFLRPDGSSSQLTPKLNAEGKPTGAFHLTSSYTRETEVGPGPVASHSGIRKGAANRRTYADIRDKSRGVLGDAAITTNDFINDMIAGNFMEDPVTRNAYRDVIAPMVARGELSLDDPGLVGGNGRLLFAPGSQARALVEQALVEMGQRKIDPNRPVIGGAEPLSLQEILRARDLQVMASEDEIRRGVAEEIETEMGLDTNPGVSGTYADEEWSDDALASPGEHDKRERGGFGIERDPDQVFAPRFAAAKQMALESLRAGLDDSEALYSAGYRNDAQAELLAKAAMRAADGGGDPARELADLLGGEVRGGFDRRVGTGVTGANAQQAREIRAKYQGQAPGLPYDRQLAEAGIPQMSYGQMAIELSSADPDKQERAMQALQGVIGARAEKVAPDTGTAFNAPPSPRATQNYGPVQEQGLMSDLEIAQQYAPDATRDRIVEAMSEPVTLAGGQPQISPRKRAAMEFVNRMRSKFNL